MHETTSSRTGTDPTTPTTSGPPADQLEQAEIAAEQRHVDRVYVRLGELELKAEALAREGRGRASTMVDLGGVREEHYTGLYERDVLVHHAARRVASLDAQHEGLVFGRLDRRDGEVHYVGRLGVRDEEQEPLVLDWRAPAAGVFYQATAAEPLGVVRRRVLRSRGTRVVGVQDDLLDADAAPDGMPVIGEGALMAALTSARGPAMRDIVATIQREQDEIIRSPAKGATLIAGGPGTGKTVVALHRAAYLLYANRRRMEAGGVLVVGPSGVFMDYIERVLPSLGESSATLRPIGGLLESVDAHRHDPPACAAVKGSLRMRTVLSRAVRDRVPGAPEDLRLYVGGRILALDAEALDRIRLEALRGNVRRNRARADVARRLADALWHRLGSSRGDAGSHRDFVADLREREAFWAFLDAWWPVVTATEVLGWLADPTRLARYTDAVLRVGEAELLTRSWKRDDGPSVEDVPLLDELIAMLGAPPPDAAREEPSVHGDRAELTTAADRAERDAFAARSDDADDTAPYDEYAHILVDEAQDLSPMQWRMLGRRGRQATWTVVGDPAQSSWGDPAESAKARDAAIGARTRRHFTLTTNYRNSREIFDVAGRVIRTELPDTELPRAVRETGVAPRHVATTPDRRAATVRACARSLLDEVEGTVCLIVPEGRLAECSGIVAELREELPATLAPDRLSAATAIATKGLEYDAAVVVEPAEIVDESPAGTRTLYVVLTRATQRLATVSSDPRGTALVDPGASGSDGVD